MDSGAKDLVEKHIPLVERIASHLAHRSRGQVSTEELMGYGTEGLIEAARRYDPARGVPFESFAYYRIRGSIMDGMKQMIGLPTWIREQAGIAETFDSVLEAESERPAPSDTAEAARALALSLGALVTGFILLSSMPEGSLRDDRRPSVEEHTLHEEEHQLLAAGLNVLTAKQRQVVEMHYQKGLSFSDIGVHLGIHKTSVSRQHAQALKRLREHLEYVYQDAGSTMTGRGGTG